MYFIQGKKSEYQNQWSFRSNMTQEDILCSWDDLDRAYEVRDMLATTPSVQYHLFQENPLDNNYALYSIDRGDGNFWKNNYCVMKYDDNTCCVHAGESIEFISDTNTVTGEVVYKTPDEGIDLLVFTNNNNFLPNMS